MKIAEIVTRLKTGELPPFRPIVKLPENSDVNPSVLNLMKDCWDVILIVPDG